MYSASFSGSRTAIPPLPAVELCEIATLDHKVGDWYAKENNIVRLT